VAHVGFFDFILAEIVWN